MTNLILCGGSGTRLWPISRNAMPKQFVPLLSGRSLFQDTVDRNKSVAKNFWVASNVLQFPLVKEQMGQSNVATFGTLIEPAGRNTAPAIAIACLAMDPQELVLVTPSDHLVAKRENYLRALEEAKVPAEDGFIVTFGISPAFPETGFGYIEADGDKILSFREKPDLETARGYVASGRYLWNSGMFLFRAGVFLEELKRFAPLVYFGALEAFNRNADSYQAPSLEAMQAIPAVSIDYAVMEKTQLGRVIACDPGWSDLGSFDALFDLAVPQLDGNRVIATTQPILIDAKNNLVVGVDRQIALVDVDDLLVVDTSDAILVMRRGSGQKVKEVVEEIRRRESSGSVAGPTLL